MKKRSDTDRRSSRAVSRFPFRNCDGELVRKDRRKLPDRRLAGIEVEWLEMIAARP